MDEFEHFDPALFGAWAQQPTYDAGSGLIETERAANDEALRAKAASILLEVKSADASPGDDLRRLLNDMTGEMREQFDYFRDLRRAAEIASDAEIDEAQAKIARADVKAATDAMSLIIRTLEKVDALQRQIARDRDLEAERNAGTESHENAKAKFLKLIDDKAVMLFEQWKRDGARPAEGGVGSAAGTGPPDEPASTSHCGGG